MRKKILIAEDDLSTREALAKLAVLNGYDVVPVSDGLGYLSAVSKEKFNVIITDLMMPELDGVLATDILKIEGDDTPVIAITALTPEDTRHVKDRFVKIFYKPVESKELFDFVKATV